MTKDDIKETIEKSSWIFTEEYMVSLYLIITFIFAPYFCIKEIYDRIVFYIKLRVVKKIFKKIKDKYGIEDEKKEIKKKD